MKLDVSKWYEVNNGKEIDTPKGRLWLRATQEIVVWITTQGVETLAGVGKEIDVTLTCCEQSTFRVDAGKGVRVFVYHPAPQSYSQDGREVFTNIDRQLHESGNLSEVRREMRKFMIEQQFTRLALREERDAIRRERAALQTPPSDPQPKTDQTDETPAEKVPETKEG